MLSDLGAVLMLTVAATLAGMNAGGIPMHRISLGALIIALGMMVDNAIVVVEGMLVGLKQGKNRLEAARAIVGQMLWPLLGGTLVGIIAFAPIGLAPGQVAVVLGAGTIGMMTALAALAVTVHQQPVSPTRRPPVFAYRGESEPQVPSWARWPGLSASVT